MERVLSAPAPRGCHGPSSYVTKRLCISIVFVVGFMCIIIGHIIGKISTQHEYLVKHQNVIHLDEFHHIGSDLLGEIRLLSSKMDDFFSMKKQIEEGHLNKNDLINIITALNCSVKNETTVDIIEKEKIDKYLHDRQFLFSLIELINKNNIKKLADCIENAISVLNLVHLR